MEALERRDELLLSAPHAGGDAVAPIRMVEAQDVKHAVHDEPRQLLA